MKQKKCLLLLLMFAMTFTAFAWNGTTKSERFSGRMERAQLPSSMTASGMYGRTDEATSNTDEGSLRGGPPDNPPEPLPIGGGLGLLTLCAGAYLFNSNKNKK